MKISETHLELYSKNSLLLQTIESLITHDRIFVGNQTDDFSIAGVLKGSNRVLLLGLGYGGAIRPILAGNNNIQITAVDMNPKSLNACSLILEEFFPNITKQLNYVLDDADNFLRNYTGLSFDTVCIDLYTDTGYPSIVFNGEFWSNIKKILSENGTVLFNSWGLPQQLEPLKINTAQTAIANIMINNFPYLSYLPHRRNITFIANFTENIEIKNNICVDNLIGLDRVLMKFLPLRVKYVERLSGENIDYSNKKTDILTLEEFDQVMNKQWLLLIQNCNKALEDKGCKKIKSMIELLENPEIAKLMTIQLLESRAPESATLPVLLGAYAFDNPEGLDWYFQWLLEECDILFGLNPEWFINTAFWQLLSISVNPFANYSNWSNCIENVIDKINEHEQ